MQQYSDIPGIVLQENLKDYFFAFTGNKYFSNNPYLRLGTGEFTDSLMLDGITEYSSELSDFFSNKHVWFELKTKSANIENLLRRRGRRNIVISWSLNPQSIIETEEYGTSPLIDRLNSAKEVFDAGYSIGFHLDPIICTSDWKSKYADLIEQVFNTIAERKIAWISLGTLRFNKNLKLTAENRFPKTKIYCGDLFLGRDGKMRYLKQSRIETYKHVIKHIRKFGKSNTIYLCMESSDVWTAVFGKKINYANIFSKPN